jgi:DNA polymerase IIIc chi subunit
MRALLRAPSEAEAERLNLLLWTYDARQLPAARHGQATAMGGRAADLSDRGRRESERRPICLAQVGGAEAGGSTGSSDASTCSTATTTIS